MVNSVLCMACAYRSVEHGLGAIEHGTFAPQHACGEVIFIENGASRNGNCVRSDIFRVLVALTRDESAISRRLPSALFSSPSRRELLWPTQCDTHIAARGQHLLDVDLPP